MVTYLPINEALVQEQELVESGKLAQEKPHYPK